MASINYIDIDWPDLFKPIPSVKSNQLNRIRVNREIIPIIFVPGIMGSRLKNTKSGQSVWDPDREIMCMLRKYGGFWNTPAQRKRMLIGETFHPEHLEVDVANPEHNKKFYSFLDPWRADRGWGGVYWGSYGKFLEQLQNHKWDRPVNGSGSEQREIVGKCFEFPVYAFGYNWTDSNFRSGQKLAAKITEIIRWYKSKGRLCKHVILVSHSMGGLVCRSACMIHNAEENVLGVIHGVQPATGAPAAYWRMKAGFERVGTSMSQRLASKASAWVLGTNGEEVTCILGNAPGGLELLPNQHYTDNNGERGWLRVAGKGGKEFLLPRHGDPYNEIYKVKANQFWRLINPDWLAPTNRLTLTVSSNNHRKDPWPKYIKCVNEAEFFHLQLEALCHENTYQFYSCSLNTVDKISFNREKLEFLKRELPTGFGFPAVIETTETSRKSSSRGLSIMYVDEYDQEINPPLPAETHLLSMSHPDNCRGGGDGTVPDSSGNALKTVLDSYQLHGVEHQAAYGDANAMGYVFKRIRSLALKRIKEGEVASAR